MVRGNDKGGNGTGDRDRHDDPRRQLLTGIGALVGFAVLIGAVLSAAVLGLTRMALGGDEPAAAPPAQAPTAPAPSEEPAESAENAENAEEAGEVQEAQDAGQADEGRRGDRTRERRDRRGAGGLTLTAAREVARPFQRVRLRGMFRGRDGARLQVQRHEGGWVDFPTGATVRDGRFSTYVAPGRPGPNRFRVVHKPSGRTSSAVTVRVR